MKRVLGKATVGLLDRYWPLLVGAALLLLGVGGLVADSSSHTKLHNVSPISAPAPVPHIAKLGYGTRKTAVPIPNVPYVPNCYNNPAGKKLLLISISQQHIWACSGSAIVNQSAVTTGASALTNVHDATPLGTWHIYSKVRNTRLKGCDVNGCWNDAVKYWMPFDGSIGFHDSAWQTFPYGSQLYKTKGSHGCVHLPASMATWVYNWAPIGTTVTVKA